jgi:hypothetical protein
MDTDASPPATPTRQRSLQDSPGLATLAVEMLQSRLAVLPLGADDARALLPFLHRLDLPQGCALFKEGQRAHNDHMLLILRGPAGLRHGPARWRSGPACWAPASLTSIRLLRFWKSYTPSGD